MGVALKPSERFEQAVQARTNWSIQRHKFATQEDCDVIRARGRESIEFLRTKFLPFIRLSQ